MRATSLPVETTGSAQRPDRPAWPDPFPPGRALVALAVVVFLTLCWVLRGFLTDDAWISVRYAENLASGDIANEGSGALRRTRPPPCP